MDNIYLTPDEQFDRNHITPSSVVLPNKAEIMELTCWQRDGNRYFPRIDRDCPWACYQATSMGGYPHHHQVFCPTQPWYCGHTEDHDNLPDCRWVCLEPPHTADKPHIFETQLRSFS